MITLDKDNVRIHPDANKAAIKKSLSSLGAGRSILVDADDVLIAGNGVYEQAEALGIPVRTIETNGKELIAVKRTDLYADDEKRKALAIADNRLTDLSEFDDEALNKMLDGMSADMQDLAGYAVDPNDLMNEGNTDEDEVPEVTEATCKLGELWILGNHRLLCGDSTDKEQVEKLMDGEKADMVFTDPPYGVAYSGGIQYTKDGKKTDQREKLANDDTTDIYLDSVPMMAKFCDGPCYVWFADTKALDVYSAILSVGEIHALIIWKKGGGYGALGANYKQAHEPCLYWKPKGSTLRWAGASTESTIWDISKDGRNEFHPTQKPVALAEHALSNHEADTVLDLFLGSGSTLIACEKTNRKCYGMELDPHYCDVIIKRWEDYTGESAVLYARPS